MLTNKQNQLLSFLIKRIEKDGISPSYEEICLELNEDIFSSTSLAISLSTSPSTTPSTTAQPLHWS